MTGPVVQSRGGRPASSQVNRLGRCLPTPPTAPQRPDRLDRLRDDRARPERDALIEVAALVTDCELNMLGEGIDLVIKPPPRRWSRWTTSSATMHTTSGLLEELDAGHRRMRGGRGPGARLRPRVGAGAGKAPLGGNTVATDRGFLARDMPELDAHLHYRIIDVSSIKELVPPLVPAGLLRGPRQAGRAPGPGRHPREHRRAALLPRGRVRARAGSRLRRRQGDRRTARRGPRLSRGVCGEHAPGPCSPPAWGDPGWSRAPRRTGYDSRRLHAGPCPVVSAWWA